MERKWRSEASAFRSQLHEWGGNETCVYPRPWTEPLVASLRPRLHGCSFEASSHAARTQSVELLDLAFLHRCLDLGASVRDACHDQATRAEVAKGLWVDLSQSIQRKPWRFGPMPTYTTSSLLYSYEHDCQLEPEEALAVYGRPVLHEHQASLDDMRDLVGNCVAAQPLAALIHCALLTLGRSVPGLWESPLPSSHAGR